MKIEHELATCSYDASHSMAMLRSSLELVYMCPFFFAIMNVSHAHCTPLDHTPWPEEEGEGGEEEGERGEEERDGGKMEGGRAQGT